MESLFLAALNGLSYGMLLFMLSAGLTVIFSMMGVLNFAHASFYMVGAYLASTLANIWGFAWALLLAPLCVGLLGMAFERYGLRRVRRQGHVAELLLTFGLSFLLLEMVQLVWGRGSVSSLIPETLQGSLFTFYDMPFSRYRAFIMAMAIALVPAFAMNDTRVVVRDPALSPRMHPPRCRPAAKPPDPWLPDIIVRSARVVHFWTCRPVAAQRTPGAAGADVSPSRAQRR